MASIEEAAIEAKSDESALIDAADSDLTKRESVAEETEAAVNDDDGEDRE